jgi:hypothetical protein
MTAVHVESSQASAAECPRLSVEQQVRPSGHVDAWFAAKSSILSWIQVMDAAVAAIEDAVPEQVMFEREVWATLTLLCWNCGHFD